MVKGKWYLAFVCLLVPLVLTLMALAAVAIGEDEVYTTIDVDYHHLGDHYVPTYQPQTPEGVVYERNFTVSVEVENPAIKMWIRGLVPPENVSIDFVRLYLNDQLLGYLNEYAMGTGSIYEIDDEVEIEVSIEEGILVDGKNHLKLVTGWGTSEYDRDDIMFWNIRLVRARPLEVSCNLITPSPGDVHYPDLDTEEVSLLVWNDRHVDALQWMRVTVDPGGAGTQYRWVQNVNKVILAPDATKHATFPSGWADSSKDLLNRTWTVRVRVSFLWNFPTEGPVDILVEVRDDQTKMHNFLFEEVLTVQTRLEMTGPVYVVAQDQGPLGPGSWVRGGELITVSVPPLVYGGTYDVYPLSGRYSYSLSWGGEEVARAGQASGAFWSRDWTVPMVARASTDLTIRAIDLPAGATPPAPISLRLEVDGRPPAWFDLAPKEGSWHTIRSVEAWGDVSDGDGVGVDPFSVEFQVWDGGAWGEWTPGRLVMTGGSGGKDRARTVLSLPEGSDNGVRWRSYDMVGNGPSVSPAVRFGIDLQPVSLEPMTETGWMMSLSTSVSCQVMDPDPGDGSSGVDPATIEYSVLVAGSTEWTSWTSANSTVEADGTGAFRATAQVAIGEGGLNYVRWRARDTAGNPITVSAPDTLMVDTTAPQLVAHWPSGRTFDSGDEARSVATFTDGEGSGVDMARVECSVSAGGRDSFGDWSAVNASGSPADLVRGERLLPSIGGHDNWVRWRVWDLAGNGPAEFGPFQLKVNLPPRAVIASPIPGSTIHTDDTFWLSGEGSSDPDPEDDLVFEWWSDVDGPLGLGRQIPGVLSLGEHTITLRVDDGLGGDHVSVATTTVTLVERTEVKEPLSPWLILLLIVLVVASLVAVRELRERRRRRLGNGQ